MAFTVELVDFADNEPALRQVRETVFVREQNVPLELEWDGLDPACQHILAVDDSGLPIGTGRLTPDRHIGRLGTISTVVPQQFRLSGDKRSVFFYTGGQLDKSSDPRLRGRR